MQIEKLNLSERTIFINRTNISCIAINNENSIDMASFSIDNNYLRLPTNTLFNSFICTDFSIAVFSSIYIPINKFDKIKNSGTSTFVKNKSNNVVFVNELKKSKTILFANTDIHEKIRKIENKYFNLLQAIAYKKNNVRGKY